MAPHPRCLPDLWRIRQRVLPKDRGRLPKGHPRGVYRSGDQHGYAAECRDFQGVAPDLSYPSGNLQGSQITDSDPAPGRGLRQGFSPAHFREPGEVGQAQRSAVCDFARE